MTTAITLVEKFLGEELTAATAARLADAPIEQIAQLASDHLIPFYYDWLENEAKSRQTEETPIFHCVDPYQRGADHDIARLNRVKALLLYFPGVAVPDPLAEALWPHAMAAQLQGTLGERLALPLDTEDELRRRMRAAFDFLAAIRPVLANDEVRLLPSTFALDYPLVQNRARQEMAALKSLPANLRAKYQQFDEILIGAVKVWGWICADCAYTPLAGTQWVKDLLRTEIEVQGALGRQERSGLPRLDIDVAATVSADGLPGVSQVPLREIVWLRRNEEAFDRWRRDLRDVLRLVWESAPRTPQQFKVEFGRAVEDRLMPRIEALKEKTKTSPALTTLLLPAALTIGGGVVTATIVSSPAPLVATAVAASAGAIGWLGQQLFTRFGTSGRQAASLRQFYGHFIETPRA